MKVSILCGVYNAEKKIKRLLDSLLEQTYDNIEIILVVNASFDKSERIIKNYEDERIKLYITEEKLGAGGARKKALNMASGEYIAVVDCDDYVGKNYIHHMVETINKDNHPDIVFTGFHRVDTCGKIKYTRKFQDTNSALYQSVAPWAKMYRREFLQRTGLEFGNIPFGEDIVFTSGVIMAKPSMALSTEADYYWEDNPDSTSHGEIRYFPDKNLEVAFSYFKDYINSFSPIDDQASYLLYKYIMWYLLQSGRSVGRKRMRGEYEEAMDMLCRFYPEWEISCKRYMKQKFGERTIVMIALKNLLRLRKIRLCKLFLEVYSCLPMERFWPSL